MTTILEIHSISGIRDQLRSLFGHEELLSLKPMMFIRKDAVTTILNDECALDILCAVLESANIDHCHLPGLFVIAKKSLVSAPEGTIPAMAVETDGSEGVIFSIMDAGNGKRLTADEIGRLGIMSLLPSTKSSGNEIFLMDLIPDGKWI